MRVLILSQYYKPEPIPKPVELAAELARQGHTVYVLTGLPNYPAGTLYPGFRLRLVQHEVLDGIPVVRTFEYPYHGQRVLGRLLNYGSFMLSAPLGSLFLPRCDVGYVWHPPLSVGVAAWMVRLLRGVPFVYDVQDIWPESAVASGLLRNGWLVSGMSRLERFVYRQASHVLVLTDDARSNLIAKGVPPDKVSMLPQWAEEDLFIGGDPQAATGIREEFGWGERFVVLFAGNLGLVQGLETVVRAAAELRSDSSVRIVLVGDGSDKARLEQTAAKMQVGANLQFVDRQPFERMPAFLAAADALLVHLKNSALNEFVIPSKTFAYMAAARPILMAMSGAGAKLVEQADAGVIVAPEQPQQLAAAIRSLASQPIAAREAMGQRSRAYLLEHHSKSKVMKSYFEVLEKAARAGSRA